MSSSGTARRSGPTNEFFLDGEGVNRQVLQTELCKFLGNDATSRPAKHDGRPGYIIRAIRPFTSAMVDDLKKLSAEYESESRQYQRRGAEVPQWEQSKTKFGYDRELSAPANPRDSREYATGRYQSGPDRSAYPVEHSGYQGYAAQHPGYAQAYASPAGYQAPPYDVRQFTSSIQQHGIPVTAGRPTYAQPDGQYGYMLEQHSMPGQQGGAYQPAYDPRMQAPGYAQPVPGGAGRGIEDPAYGNPSYSHGHGAHPTQGRQAQQPSPFSDSNDPYTAPRRR